MEYPIIPDTPSSHEEVEQRAWLRSKKLCGRCQAIFDHWYSRDSWSSKKSRLKHHNLTQLERSAETGCPICELFLNRFLPSEVDGIRQLAPLDESSLDINKLREDTYSIRLYFSLLDESISHSIVVLLAGMHPC
jgi:hypothetical protein